jgi:hypothetical protein
VLSLGNNIILADTILAAIELGLKNLTSILSRIGYYKETLGT